MKLVLSIFTAFASTKSLEISRNLLQKDNGDLLKCYEDNQCCVNKCYTEEDDGIWYTSLFSCDNGGNYLEYTYEKDEKPTDCNIKKLGTPYGIYVGSDSNCCKSTPTPPTKRRLLSSSNTHKFCENGCQECITKECGYDCTFASDNDIVCPKCSNQCSQYGTIKYNSLRLGIKVDPKTTDKNECGFLPSTGDVFNSCVATFYPQGLRSYEFSCNPKTNTISVETWNKNGCVGDSDSKYDIVNVDSTNTDPSFLKLKEMLSCDPKASAKECENSEVYKELTNL